MLDDNGKSAREADNILAFIGLFLVAVIPFIIGNADIIFAILAMCTIWSITLIVIALVISCILQVLKRIQPFKYIYELYW